MTASSSGVLVQSKLGVKIRERTGSQLNKPDKQGGGAERTGEKNDKALIKQTYGVNEGEKTGMIPDQGYIVTGWKEKKGNTKR